MEQYEEETQRLTKSPKRVVTAYSFVVAGILTSVFLMYFVIGPAIAKPYHEERLHRQQICEDAGGRLVNSYGGLACVEELKVLD